MVFSQIAVFAPPDKQDKAERRHILAKGADKSDTDDNGIKLKID